SMHSNALCCVALSRLDLGNLALLSEGPEASSPGMASAPPAADDGSYGGTLRHIGTDVDHGSDTFGVDIRCACIFPVISIAADATSATAGEGLCFRRPLPIQPLLHGLSCACSSHRSVDCP